VFVHTTVYTSAEKASGAKIQMGVFDIHC